VLSKTFEIESVVVVWETSLFTPSEEYMDLSIQSERESLVLKDIAMHGIVHVKDLAKKLGVSEVTVRKDLESLEQRNLLRRIRGGAIRVSSADEGYFSYRLRREEPKKKAIARYVSGIVKDGDTIALDSSTTCFYLARALLDRNGLVVVTTSLPSATLLVERSNSMVIMPGGVVRRSSISMTSHFGDALADRGPITHGFFGAVTVTPKFGLMELDHGEAETKKDLAGACLNVYGLVTSEKVNHFGLHSFATPNHVSQIYTDENVPLEFTQSCFQAGMPVTAVPVSVDTLSGDDTPNLSTR